MVSTSQQEPHRGLPLKNGAVKREVECPSNREIGVRLLAQLDVTISRQDS